MKKPTSKTRSFKTTWFFNKYLLCLLFFMVWILIFDRYSYRTQLLLSKSIEKLEAEKSEFQDLYVKALNEKNQLLQNPEKFARENYFMRKKNEQVFYIE